MRRNRGRRLAAARAAVQRSQSGPGRTPGTGQADGHPGGSDGAGDAYLVRCLAVAGGLTVVNGVYVSVGLAMRSATAGLGAAALVLLVGVLVYAGQRMPPRGPSRAAAPRGRSTATRSGGAR